MDEKLQKQSRQEGFTSSDLVKIIFGLTDYSTSYDCNIFGIPTRNSNIYFTLNKMNISLLSAGSVAWAFNRTR